MHQEERGSGQQALRPSPARHAEAVADVGDGLGVGERSQVPAERDALVQLGEGRVEEDGRELGLADQHEAEELLRAGLEIREQPELLEHVDGDGLCLVDHDHGQTPRLALREEMRVQGIHDVDLALAGRRHPELARDPLQQVLPGQRRVEDVGRRHLGAEVGEEGAQQRRLAGADVAADADEPARLDEPGAQVREGLRVLGGEVEVARVGCQPKRRIGEPEERFVHPAVLPLYDPRSL